MERKERHRQDSHTRGYSTTSGCPRCDLQQPHNHPRPILHLEVTTPSAGYTVPLCLPPRSVTLRQINEEVTYPTSAPATPWRRATCLNTFWRCSALKSFGGSYKNMMVKKRAKKMSQCPMRQTQLPSARQSIWNCTLKRSLTQPAADTPESDQPRQNSPLFFFEWCSSLA